MLSQFSISIVAAVLAVTSPLLHYWSCTETALTLEKPSCCQHSHDAAPNEHQQPSDEPDCNCETRVAIAAHAPCDIAELAAQHVPGNDPLANIATSDSNVEQFSGLRIAMPVHFSLPTDGGSLCARLGRFLI
jgi:hypothetical protein